MTDKTIQRSKSSIYFQAVRAFSFPASMIPCVLGAMFAFLLFPNQTLWYLLPFIMISTIFLHSASNVISDYDDYKMGVDDEKSLGGSRVLVEKLIDPKKLFRFGITLFGIAVLFGLPIILTRGYVIFLLGLLGIGGGFFYTRRPLGFKYIALGDFIFFLLYGPAIVLGTFYALTGTYSMIPLLGSFPIGLLVVGILHANNFRDIVHDRRANIKTLASVMGENFAKGEYLFLIAGAYVVIIVLVVISVLTPWSLIVLISLPPAIKNMNQIKGVKIEDTTKIAMLDVQTAQLTLIFGLLLSISVLISKFV